MSHSWQAAVSSVRGWDRNVKLFFLMNVLFQTGSGLFSVLYNLYVQAMGYDQALNGRLISAASFATALMFLPIGWAGDRYGRKWLLMAGIMASGLIGLGRSYAESPAMLEGSALLAGVFAASIQVLAVPFLADYAPKAERLRILSYHFAATLAAQVLGSTGGGLLADLLQAAGMGRVAALQLALAVGSAGMWAAAVPLLGIRERGGAAKKAVAAAAPQQEPGSEHNARADAHFEAGAQTARASEVAPAGAQPAKTGATSPAPTGWAGDWRIIIGMGATQFITGIGSGLVIPYLNLYFTDRFDVSLTAVGIIISLGQVMTIASMLLGPQLVRRVGQVRAILTFQLLSLPFLLLTGFTTLLSVATVGYLFRQALMNAANPIFSTVLVERVSPARRGTANSINQTVFMLGWAFMGLVQPAILSHYGTYWGYTVTFCLTGGLYIVSSLTYFLLFRDKRSARVPTDTPASGVGSTV